MPDLSGFTNAIPKAWSATKAAIVASPLDEYAVASVNTIIKGSGGIGSALSVPVLATAGAILSISEGLFPQGLTSEEQEQKAIAEAEAKLLAQANGGNSSVIQAAPPPPFEGGQGSGVSYQVRFNADYYSIYDSSEVINRTQTLWTSLNGAITAIGLLYLVSGGVKAHIGVTFEGGNQTTSKDSQSVSSSFRIIPDSINFILSRTDGQPDTDGNLYTGEGISSESTSLKVPALTVNPGTIVGILKPGYSSVSSVSTIPTPVRIINDLSPVPDEKIISTNPETELIASATPPIVPQPIIEAPDKPILDSVPVNVRGIPRTIKADIQQETHTSPSLVEPTTTVRHTVAGKTPVTIKTHTDGNGIKTTTTTVTATGKTVSIKRSVPAGVTVTQVGVSGGIQRTSNTGTFVVGTPTTTGIEATPTIPTIEQAPALPEVAGLGLTAAAVGAVVYGEKGVEVLTAAAAAGTCRTTQPGQCMQNNVVDPLKAGQASLGELFNNVANTALAAQNAAILAVVQSTNAIVSHSTYGLQAVQAFAANAWATTRIGKVLEVINTFLILHNAAMLSSNLASSLGDIISAITNNTINLVKNEDGSNIDINQILGDSIEGFLTSILGQETYQNASATFQKSSRILSSAANVANTIQFSLAGMAQGLETVGNYTGKIGNSLKKAGAVFENSYQWMSENLTVKTGRLGQIQAVIDGLEQVEQVASDLQSVTSEFKEVQDNVTQIGAEFTKVKAEVTAKETEKATAEATVKTSSQGTQPSASDYTPDPLN